MNDYAPVEIDPHDRVLLEKIGRLRVLAWSTVMPGAARRTECWLDEFELVARHWVIFHDGEPVAAARLSVHQRLEDVPEVWLYENTRTIIPSGPLASLNRLVTHPAFRGRGFSDALDNVRLEALDGMTCLCSITLDALAAKRGEQLRRAGFVPIGHPCLEPPHHLLQGIVAQPMIRHGSPREVT